jgi:glycosyltransferase involved in cell wall biosynthesis
VPATRLTIAICCYNAAARLEKVLAAVARQQVPGDYGFETVLIDNASTDGTAGAAANIAQRLGLALRIVREPTPGLTHARRRAAIEAGGDILSYVDDDNIVAPDWVVQAVRFMDEHPRAGVVGGVVEPIFEDPSSCPPDFWQRYAINFAVRHEGDRAQRTGGQQEPPYGAGLTIRTALGVTLLCDIRLHLSDRKGKHLTSGGDAEMGFVARRLGFETWYDPALRLGHVLPAARLTPDYLARLEKGIEQANFWLKIVKDAAPLPTRRACAARALRELGVAARMAILAKLRPSGHRDSAHYPLWARQMYTEGRRYADLAIHDPMGRITRYARRRRPKVAMGAYACAVE